MKINIDGMEIDATPAEFAEFLKLKRNEPAKDEVKEFTYNIPSPSTLETVPSQKCRKSRRNRDDDVQKVKEFLKKDNTPVTASGLVRKAGIVYTPEITVFLRKLMKRSKFFEWTKKGDREYFRLKEDTPMSLGKPKTFKGMCDNPYFKYKQERLKVLAKNYSFEDSMKIIGNEWQRMKKHNPNAPDIQPDGTLKRAFVSENNLSDPNDISDKKVQIAKRLRSSIEELDNAMGILVTKRRLYMSDTTPKLYENLSYAIIATNLGSDLERIYSLGGRKVMIEQNIVVLK